MINYCVNVLIMFIIEAKRRKWLEDYPETTSNDEPVLFDTSIIPWWAWMKRYHLPEAELLNGDFQKTLISELKIQDLVDKILCTLQLKHEVILFCFFLGTGRAAMVGFFMAYFVDSLTGVGLVDQMGNFFCKTLLFVAVAGVLFIRKNEDFDKLKDLFDETTLYDKQWQAAWKEPDSSTVPPKK